MDEQAVLSDGTDHEEVRFQVCFLVLIVMHLLNKGQMMIMDSEQNALKMFGLLRLYKCIVLHSQKHHGFLLLNTNKLKARICLVLYC